MEDEVTGLCVGRQEPVCLCEWCAPPFPPTRVQERERGHGENGRNHGDLFARLIVEVPSRLNSEKRRKLEEFAALCGDENTPMRKSFFDRAKEFFR